jgi:biotin transport system substrate-specific component
MATTFATPNTLLGLYQPRSQAARLVSAVAVAFLGSVLLTVSAKINVPVWPVPVTLQTMAVAVLAAALGARLGVAAVALYLAQGMAGLPVFAGAGAGLPYLMGPTGGFILSWLPMAFIIGYAADKGLSRKFLPLFSVMLGASVFGFAAGFAWLLILSGQAGWIDQSNVLVSAYKAFAALTVVGGWALVARK